MSFSRLEIDDIAANLPAKQKRAFYAKFGLAWNDEPEIVSEASLLNGDTMVPKENKTKALVVAPRDDVAATKRHSSKPAPPSARPQHDGRKKPSLTEANRVLREAGKTFLDIKSVLVRELDGIVCDYCLAQQAKTSKDKNQTTSVVVACVWGGMTDRGRKCAACSTHGGSCKISNDELTVDYSDIQLGLVRDILAGKRGTPASSVEAGLPLKTIPSKEVKKMLDASPDMSVDNSEAESIRVSGEGEVSKMVAEFEKVDSEYETGSEGGTSEVIVVTGHKVGFGGRSGKGKETARFHARTPSGGGSVVMRVSPSLEQQAHLNERWLALEERKQCELERENERRDARMKTVISAFAKIYEFEEEGVKNEGARKRKRVE